MASDHGFDELPNSPEAERVVIGSCMRTPELMADACSLKASDFYAWANQVVFTDIAAAWANGGPLGPDAVLIRLGDARGKEVGHAYLGQLWNGGTNEQTFQEALATVRNLSIRRRLHFFGAEVAKAALAKDLDTAHLLADAERKLWSVSIGAHQGKTKTFAQLWPAVFDEIGKCAEARRDGVTENGIPSGFADLDGATGGFQPHDFVVIAARPGVGKSVFLANLACNMSRAGIGSLFVSLEMRHGEVIRRIISNRSEVPATRIRQGFLGDEDFDRLRDAGLDLGSQRGQIHFEEVASENMGQICSMARRLAMRKEIGAVFIDYLQLIESDRSKANRQEEVASISRRCKLLARDLKIPVIAAAQVNRQSERNGSDSKPKLSELRESGAIEQDADLVVILSNDSEQEQAAWGPLAPKERDEVRKREGFLELDIAKNRDGPLGAFTLFHRKTIHRLENFERG